MLHVRCSLVYNLVTLHEAHELFTRAARHPRARHPRVTMFYVATHGPAVLKSFYGARGNDVSCACNTLVPPSLPL